MRDMSQLLFCCRHCFGFNVNLWNYTSPLTFLAYLQGLSELEAMLNQTGSLLVNDQDEEHYVEDKLSNPQLLLWWYTLKGICSMNLVIASQVQSSIIDQHGYLHQAAAPLARQSENDCDEGLHHKFWNLQSDVPYRQENCLALAKYTWSC